jgi:phage repressor protein C with HTH and peptisase S24 domain
MNRRELKKYAQEHGFKDTTELATAILQKATEAQDLQDELAETKRRLDLAVLREQRTKAEVSQLKKSKKAERSDEEQIDALLDDMVRATAVAVEEGRVALDGRKAGALWRLT